jgi:Carboxypeptidase regulatory-like domain/TonB-dependent Receptor Plug Domain
MQIKLFRIFCVALLLTSFSIENVRNAEAQTTSGTIAGTVVDQNGALVPNATLTAVQREHRIVQRATSNASGEFTFIQMQAGTYDISASAPGLKTYTRVGFVLEANASVNVGAFRLSVGSVASEITVISEGLQLETENDERSYTLNNEQINNIAINGRNGLALVELIPGATTVGDYSVASKGAPAISINGARTRANNYILDGLGDIDPGNNGSAIASISIDNLQEFRVVTNNFQAQYGRSGGSQVIEVTRSGTSAYHGSGFFYHRNDSLNANSWINNFDHLPRSEFRINDAGFNFGGPVNWLGRNNSLGKRLFFYVGEEWQQQLQPVSVQDARVPTALERVGDFSKSIDFGGHLHNYIRDYTTGKPCSSSNTSGCFQDGGVLGKIPAARIDALGAQVLNAYPLPNIPGGTSYNYQSDFSYQYPRREDLARVDYTVNEKNRVFFRFLHNKDYAANYYGLYSTVPTTPIIANGPASSLGLGLTTVVNKNSANEFLIGYGAVRAVNVPSTNALSRTALGLTDIPLLFPGPIPFDMIPDFSFNGSVLENTTSLAGTKATQDTGTTVYDIVDNYSWLWRRHSFKFGFFFERSRKNQKATTGSYPNGSYDFSDDSANPYDTGFSFANSVTGVFRTFTQSSVQANGHFRYSNVEWYGQDSWRVTPKLTLSYGMRFYWIQPQYDKNNQTSTFDPSYYDPGKAVRLFQRAKDSSNNIVAKDPITGLTMPAYAIGRIVPNSGDLLDGVRIAGQTVNRYLQKGSGVLYSPRLGFSYQLSPDAVIRGGGGIYYDRTSGDSVFQFSYQAPGVQQPIVYYGLLNSLSASAALTTPFAMNARPFNSKTPTYYNYDLELQKQMPYQILLSVGYVGTSASELLQLTNLNAIPYGAAFLPQNQDPVKESSNPTAIAGSNAKDENFLRPYQGYSDITSVQNGGSSNFNSLQVVANRRYASGLFFGIAYTWGRSLGVTSQDTDPTRIDGLTRKYDYGPLSFDRRQTFAANYIYTLPPILKGHRYISSIINEWQISGVTRFQTGAPYSVSMSIPGYNSQNLTGSYTEGPRIRIVGDPHLSVGKSPFYRLNVNAFAAPYVGDPGIGSGQGSNYLTGPGVNSTDLALQKTFTIKRAHFRMRLDAFNAFNHAQFSGIDSQAQFTTPGSTVLTNPAKPGLVSLQFGAINGVLPPRTVQLTGKFNF